MGIFDRFRGKDWVEASTESLGCISCSSDDDAVVRPEKTAFLLVNMQNGYIDDESPLCVPGAERILPACERALKAARRLDLAVYHIRRVYMADGTDVEAPLYEKWVVGGRPLSPEWHSSMDAPSCLFSRKEEGMLVKTGNSAFFRSELDQWLRERDVDTIVLSGLSASGSIMATALDGLELGYNVVVVSDAVSSFCGDDRAACLGGMERFGVQLISSFDLESHGLRGVKDIEGDVRRATGSNRMHAGTGQSPSPEQELEELSESSGLPIELLSPPSAETPCLQKIEQVGEGSIRRYLLHYKTPDGLDVLHEAVSREDPEEFVASLALLGEGKTPSPRRCLVIPIIDGGKLLLLKRFLFALNSWCVCLPEIELEEGKAFSSNVDEGLRAITGHGLRQDIGRNLTLQLQSSFSCPDLLEEGVQMAFASIEEEASASVDPALLAVPFILKRDEVGAFMDANTLPISTSCQVVLEMLANM